MSGRGRVRDEPTAYLALMFEDLRISSGPASNVASGIWFPEEAFDAETSAAVFDVATRGTFLWERPTFAVSEEARPVAQKEEAALKAEL